MEKLANHRRVFVYVQKILLPIGNGLWLKFVNNPITIKIFNSFNSFGVIDGIPNNPGSK